MSDGEFPTHDSLPELDIDPIPVLTEEMIVAALRQGAAEAREWQRIHEAEHGRFLNSDAMQLVLR